MCAAFAVLCCAPCVGLREGIAKHLRAAMERARAAKVRAAVGKACGVLRQAAPVALVALGHRIGEYGLVDL